jgi:hypothetical protein
VFHQTESKFQTWRAVAVFADGSECLVFVGRSTTHVRAGYAAACVGLLDEEEQARVVRVKLQCWEGAADRGHWVLMGELPVPTRKLAGLREPSTAAGPVVLPFRAPEEAEPPASPGHARRVAVGS